MTLEEMIRQCALLMGMDPAFAAAGAVRMESEQHLYDRLKVGINEAYRKAADLIKPVAVQTVTLDSSGCFQLSSLQKCFAGVRQICQGNTELQFRELMGKIQVFAAGGNTVRVHYYYVPDSMQNAQDAPVFSEQEVPPALYLYGAMSLYATGEGRFYEAAAWDERFANAAANVHPLFRRGRMPARRWC